MRRYALCLNLTISPEHFTDKAAKVSWQSPATRKSVFDNECACGFRHARKTVAHGWHNSYIVYMYILCLFTPHGWSFYETKVYRPTTGSSKLRVKRSNRLNKTIANGRQFVAANRWQDIVTQGALCVKLYPTFGQTFLVLYCNRAFLLDISIHSSVTFDEI